MRVRWSSYVTLWYWRWGVSTRRSVDALTREWWVELNIGPGYLGIRFIQWRFKPCARKESRSNALRVGRRYRG